MDHLRAGDGFGKFLEGYEGVFTNHRNWIAGERRVVLKTGDYSLEGMENLLALERKSLADLVDCTVTSRERFLFCCSRLAKFRWKAILVEASYEDIKRGWDTDEIQSEVHPNSVCGLLGCVAVATRHGGDRIQLPWHAALLLAFLSRQKSSSLCVSGLRRAATCLKVI